jgi:hypothetical protein
VKDLDMGAVGWWDDVLGEEFLRGHPGHNRPRGNINKIWGTAIGVEIIEGCYIRFL